jgi:hypothetical protein
MASAKEVTRLARGKARPSRLRIQNDVWRWVKSEFSLRLKIHSKSADSAIPVQAGAPPNETNLARTVTSGDLREYPRPARRSRRSLRISFRSLRRSLRSLRISCWSCWRMSRASAMSVISAYRGGLLRGHAGRCGCPADRPVHRPDPLAGHAESARMSRWSFTTSCPRAKTDPIHAKHTQEIAHRSFRLCRLRPQLALAGTNTAFRSKLQALAGKGRQLSSPSWCRKFNLTRVLSAGKG